MQDLHTELQPAVDLRAVQHKMVRLNFQCLLVVPLALSSPLVLTGFVGLLGIFRQVLIGTMNLALLVR